jgi:hypothetical protein
MAMMGLGGMAESNIQNKNAIKDQANMQTSEQANIAANQKTAFGNLAGNIGANPGPATAANQPGSAAPVYNGANIPIAGAPPGTSANPASALNKMSVPGSGAAAGAGTQLPPAVLAALKQAISGQT